MAQPERKKREARSPSPEDELALKPGVSSEVSRQDRTSCSHRCKASKKAPTGVPHSQEFSPIHSYFFE